MIVVKGDLQRGIVIERSLYRDIGKEGLAEIVIERDLQRDIVEGFAERYLLRGICEEIVVERHI